MKRCKRELRILAVTNTELPYFILFISVLNYFKKPTRCRVLKNLDYNCIFLFK